MMFRPRILNIALSVLAALIVAGCEAPAPTTADQTKPKRIVSLDYCADQYVLKLVDKSRILALSPDAGRDFSYMREEAKGVRQVRPVAEDVLALKPDLVVRAYGGGANAAAFFRRAGIPVLTVGWADTLAEIKAAIGDAAKGLDAVQRGQDVVADINARLAALQRHDKAHASLYMTPAGVTSGPGSLVHEILIAAGLDNFQSKPGWHPIPLERIAIDTPDMVVASFFGSRTNHKSGWSAMRHPVAKDTVKMLPSIYIDGAWTSCGGWYALDAIEALAAGVKQF